MELLLNLLWFTLAGASTVGWILVRRRSDSTRLPGYCQGLLVLAFILFVLFPIISITDDLARSPAALITEDQSLKDILIGSEQVDLRHVRFAAALVQAIILIWSFASWREAHGRDEFLKVHSTYDPNIENRPPPQFVCA